MVRCSDADGDGEEEFTGRLLPENKRCMSAARRPGQTTVWITGAVGVLLVVSVVLTQPDDHAIGVRDQWAYHKVRLRRQATVTTETSPALPTAPSDSRPRDQRGASADLFTPSPGTPTVTDSSEGASSEDDHGGGLHVAVIIVLAILCAVVVGCLVCGIIALFRYFYIERTKEAQMLRTLWVEGARYSPAPPRPSPGRQRHVSQTSSAYGQSQPRTNLLDTTVQSQVSTDHFRAVYPFEATEDAHLDLQPGDVVEVVEKGGDGWWRGYHGDIQGWFPASHLEPVYEGSGITLDEYTTSTTTTSSQDGRPSSRPTPDRDQQNDQGMDEVDIQLVKPQPHFESEDEEEPGSSDELTLELPSSTEESNLLQSIFNDLEKAWSKPEASTPISKDYYKVHPLESSLQPIPLAEPFDADRKADLSLQERAELEQELLQMLREDREVQEDRGIRQDQRRHHSSKPRPQTHPLDLPVNTQQRDVPQQDSGLTDQSESLSMRSYRAVYPYTPQRDDELRICQNDFLHHVSHVSDDWVMVRNTIGQEGLVPCTYITHELSDPAFAGSSRRDGQAQSPDHVESDEWDNESEVEGDVTFIEYVAIYDFEPQAEGDLALQVGDPLIITEKDQTGWCRGFHQTTKEQGWFPGNYIEMVTQESAPSTPAATSSVPLGLLAGAVAAAAAAGLQKGPSTGGVFKHEEPKGNAPSQIGAEARQVEDAVLTEDIPPPLPTCPPPTDEELEELERLQAVHVSPPHPFKNPARAPKDESFLQPGDHGRVGNHNPVRDPAAVTGQLPPLAASGATFIIPDISMNGDSPLQTSTLKNEGSPPILLRPPPGFGGSDFASSDAYGTTDSESEMPKKPPRKPPKPKLVRIPKKSLLKQVGDLGRRLAPLPQAGTRHERRMPLKGKIPEISAPILQQTSDAARIAASQELRVSFQNPVETVRPNGTIPAEQQVMASTLDSPTVSSSGILKHPISWRYQSPHGGSYEDIHSNRHASGDKRSVGIKDQGSKPQVMPNLADVGDVKTPPPHHHRNLGVSKSAPHIGHVSHLKPVVSGPVSADHTPVVQNRIKTKSLSQTHSTSMTEQRPGSRSGMPGMNNTMPHAFPATLKQRRTRRKIPRPSCPPPPRPKTAPPPRPPGPPPGRVGAHGDGVNHMRRGRDKNPKRQDQYWIELQGLDCSTDSAVMSNDQIVETEPLYENTRRNMQKPSAAELEPSNSYTAEPLYENTNNRHTLGSTAEPLYENTPQKGGQSGLINPEPLYENTHKNGPSSSIPSQSCSSLARQADQEDENGSQKRSSLDESRHSAPGDLTFVVENRKRTDHVDLSHAASDSLAISSHITTSADFDEVDYPGSQFPVIAMVNPAGFRITGPQDSFRKYKKNFGVGRKGQLVRNSTGSPNMTNGFPSTILKSPKKTVAPRPPLNGNRPQTLPHGLTCSASWHGGGDSNRDGIPDYLAHTVQTGFMPQRSRTLDSKYSGLVNEDFPDSATGPGTPDSPSKKVGPARPPPPASPVKKKPSFRNGVTNSEDRSNQPVKPPRKDKMRRAAQNYFAAEKGELSFTEDDIIQDIGKVPDRPGWTVGMLSDGYMGVYPNNAAITIYTESSADEAASWADEGELVR